MTQQANLLSPTPGQLRSIPADLPAGSTLHVWLKAQSNDGNGMLTVFPDGGEGMLLATGNSEEFQLQTLTLQQGGATELVYDPASTIVSVIYAFNEKDVLDTGIALLYNAEFNAPPVAPAGYHFRPPFGWMNDPNGFGRFGDRVHLFYQHYPHSLRWNTMHWGHAVSKDYVHWKHLPVFLFPSSELSARDDGRGGAFSGSAIPVDGENGGIRIFYTEQVAGRIPEEQIQLSAVSRDQITVEQQAIVLPERPAGLDLTPDFRDPYVIKGPDGKWKMLLGSRDRDGGVVLLYETNDPTGATGWTFVGILHREDRFRMTAAECPCIVPLNGPADDPDTLWALIFGLLTSRDPATGRRNMTTVMVGHFDGRSFTQKFEQELDFGTDAYAFQAFVDGDGPVGIAWLANWTDVSKKVDFPTAMTLPRRLVLKNDVLLTPPVEAVKTLRQHLIDDIRLARGEAVALVDGAAEIELDLGAPGAAFELALDHPSIDLGLRLDEDGLSIVHNVRDGKSTIRHIALGARPSRIRLFLDAGCIEVFADDGRWAGSKRVASMEGIVGVRLSSPAVNVSGARVWQLKL